MVVCTIKSFENVNLGQVCAEDFSQFLHFLKGWINQLIETETDGLVISSDTILNIQL